MVSLALRTRFRSTLAAVAASVALAHAAACSRSEETPAPKPAPKAPAEPAAKAPEPVAFHVTRVDVGNAIGADKKVAAPATTFKPSDTIFASVSSDGTAPSVALSARWTFEDGQLVNEATQNIAPSGPAVTEFHISKPDGWPAGKYKLEVSANGKPAGAAQFTVTD
jgi:hypothetical protein